MGRYVYHTRGIRLLFWMAVGCFAVHAVSYLLMPASMRAFRNGESKEALLLVGGTFWFPLLLGYILIFFANLERKAFIRARLDGDISMQRRMGIVTFFSNIPAVIADTALLAGCTALIIIYFCGAESRYITYIILEIISFSLNMHGLFNGRIYRITKYKRTRGVVNHE